MKRQPQPKPVIMVSSSVYYLQPLLDQIYGVLEGWGYTVWMSHKGTVPLNPNKSAFDSCLDAVEQCDLFLGLIAPFYGTGREEPDGLSITHREMLRAIDLNKTRWFLAHHDVVLARQILNQYRFTNFKERIKDENFKFQATKVLDDIRVIEMYEAAIRDDIPEVGQRTGNWVQEYITPQDVKRFLEAQFYPVERFQSFLQDTKKP